MYNYVEIPSRGIYTKEMKIYVPPSDVVVVFNILGVVFLAFVGMTLYTML